MRDGEENGKDYFFVSEEQFEDLKEKGEFLEFAKVHGNFYGTSVNFVNAEIDAGRDVVLEIDVQGARKRSKNISASRQHIYFAAIF
ncbi:MAG: hypothetical protein WKF71_08425 [Pyrinomonadaceae bacterium]